MRSFLVILSLIFVISAQSQYWFGPKVGLIYNDHIYQVEAYEKDTFNIPNDFNFQGGFALAYTATDMFSAYGEIVYERVGKTIKNQGVNGEEDGEEVNVQMTNHFLSIPVMFRVTIGKGYLKYYANGGPRLSYWLAGKGTHDLEANDEPAIYGRDEDGNALPYPFEVTFNSAKADDLINELVKNPNRLQFGLAIGGGMLFDLPNGSRIMLDARYTWSHSNMAQNSELDGNIYGSPGDVDYYRENWEYSRNYASISIGYLIGYNSQLQRKGKSTNSESNKKKK